MTALAEAEGAPKTDAVPMDTIRVELDGKYAGWWAACDADPDWAFLEDLSSLISSGQFGPTGTALLRVVQSWNFKAKDGTPAPVNHEGLRLVPARSVLLLAAGYMKRWGELPNQPAVA